MPDGSVVFEVDLDNRKLEKELTQLKRKIQSLEDQLASKKQGRLPLEENLNAVNAKLEEARKQLAVLQDERRAVTAAMQPGSSPDDFIAAYSDKDRVSARLQRQQAEVSALEKEWRAADRALKNYDSKVSGLERNLNRAKDQAGKIQKRLAAASGPAAYMARAMDRAQKSAAGFSLRLREIVRSALVFTLLSQALAALREWLGKVVAANDQSAAAAARLRGALLTLAQPLVNVIIPAFTEFVNLLAAILSRAAGFVSALFGTTAEASAEAAEALYHETEAIEGTGDAAKEAGKALAGFDEINKLSSSDNAGAAGGGAAPGIEPDFDTSFISSTLDEIINILGAALLAVGAVLAFSGVNIPLGLGLMAAGAAILAPAVAANWSAIAAMLQGPLGIVMGILSGALVVMGAVLLFSGANIPLGLGLIAAGAAGLAAAAAANWGTIQAVLQGPLGAVTALLSAALLALGAVLLFSGAGLPLGLGLILAGAIGLAASAAVNWGTIQAVLQGPLGAITALLSAALLALGAVLTFTGASLPLGIGLLIAGAAGLAASAAANWETIQNLLQGPVGTITGIVSAAALVLGAILTFSGAAIPLGLGLLAAGAAGLTAGIAANWTYLTGILGGPINALTAIVSAALLVLGAILVFTGAGTALGLGMLVAGGAGLATAVAPNWNFIQEAMSGAWNSFTSWWDAGPGQFFEPDYWADLAGGMMDGLFDGLSEIGSRITSWGNDFIGGVKDFFGIHSPSTEFQSLGGYMMGGLEIGVTGNSYLVVSAFGILFSQILTLCTQNTDLMQAEFAAFLLYLTGGFAPEWRTVWADFYDTSAQNIRGVISEIDALNARLASIERNITITITTVHRTLGGSSGSSSSSRSASARSVSLQNVPALARGAVIPPNREFLAVLGDQTSGTNIETPLSTMVQAFRQALSEMGYGGEQTVILQLDRDQLGKVVYRLNKAETRRVGVNLAGV